MSLLSPVTYCKNCRADYGPPRDVSGPHYIGWNTVRKAVLTTMRQSYSIRIALPVLMGLLALAVQPAQAQSRKPKARPTIARKAVSARARAVATAREMADTAVPRYKVDASGDLVPDLRAAAAIIYDPGPTDVLREEKSKD